MENCFEEQIPTKIMRSLLVAIICASLLVVPLPATGQVSGAALSMICDDTMMVNDPLAGGPQNISCTVSNPTAYVEKIAVQVSGDGLATTAPGDFYVDAGQEETFNVTIQWNPMMFLTLQNRTITVSAAVQEQNNLPPANTATAQNTIVLDVGSAYSACTTNASITNDMYNDFDTFLVQMDGDLGNFTVNLNYSAAPVHAENFALLSLMGCYDTTIFHRVIDNFMIQGGDFNSGDGTGGHAAKFFGYCDGQEQEEMWPQDCSSITQYTLPDEVDTGLIHEPCTVSMAKTSAPHTGGSQFFFIPEDSTPDWLDGVHSVFGTVTEGCNVVTSISELETGNGENGGVPDRPINDAIIDKITRVITEPLDTDADTIPDQDDNCPTVSNFNQTDLDGDGIGDACDDDIDGDGADNSEDAFPEDENETKDDDGDGVGNNTDAFPQDENETHDDDGDGVGNNSDAFPQDANETLDSDNDGVGDNEDPEPTNPDVRTIDDIEVNISDSSAYMITGALVFLALVILFVNRRPPKQSPESSSFVEDDSIWNT